MKKIVTLFYVLCCFTYGCKEDDTVDPIAFVKEEKPIITLLDTATTTITAPFPVTHITDSVFYYDYNPDLLLNENDSLILDVDSVLNGQLLLYHCTKYNDYGNNRVYLQTTVGVRSLDTSLLKVSIGIQEYWDRWKSVFTNDTISDSLTWVDNIKLLDGDARSGPKGMWRNSTEGYILIKILVNGNWRFGWIKTNVNNNFRDPSNVEVLDFAVSLKSNLNMIVGQKN